MFPSPPCDLQSETVQPATTDMPAGRSRESTQRNRGDSRNQKASSVTDGSKDYPIDRMRDARSQILVQSRKLMGDEKRRVFSRCDSVVIDEHINEVLQADTGGRKVNPCDRPDMQMRITERGIVRMPVISQNLFRCDINALQKTIAVFSRRDLELTWFFGVRSSPKNLSEKRERV
jgi:hypothetical protein